MADRRKLILFAFAIAVLVASLWFIRHALLIIYVSAVFAVVLKPGVDWLHRASIFGWHPGRGTALLLMVVAALALLGGLLAIALRSIIADVGGLSGTVSTHFESLRRRFHLSDFEPRVPAALQAIVPAVSGAAANILTALLLTAYLILDGARLLKQSLRIIPDHSRTRFESALHRAGGRMRHWLAGQAMLMLILGGSATLTFGLMRLPYFYLLGVFAGVANIVPLLGPLATVLLAGAVAATQSGWHVLGVVIFYLVYQQVENAFLTPNIMKSQVQLPSAVVIIALLVGSELAGIAGALVAVPTAALIAELANEYLPDQSNNAAAG